MFFCLGYFVFRIVQDVVSYFSFSFAFSREKGRLSRISKPRKVYPCLKSLELFCFTPGIGNTKSCEKNLPMCSVYYHIFSAGVNKVDCTPVFWQESCPFNLKIGYFVTMIMSHCLSKCHC